MIDERLPGLKDGPSGLLAARKTRSSVTATGRCEPRPAALRAVAGCGEHCDGPVAASPRCDGAVLSLRIPRAGRATMRRMVARVLLARRAATAPASSAPSRRSSWRSSTTARRSTSASRSSTTSTSCATSRRAARSSSRRRPRCPRARRSSSRRTASRRRCTRRSAARSHNVIDATCPLVTKVHVQARRYAAAGYTVVLIGHAGHEEVVGTMGEAPEATVLVQDVAEAEALELPARREARLHHADDALGRRDGGDHRRPAPALPARSTRRRRRTSVTRPPTGSGR